MSMISTTLFDRLFLKPEAYCSSCW